MFLIYIYYFEFLISIYILLIIYQSFLKKIYYIFFLYFKIAQNKKKKNSIKFHYLRRKAQQKINFNNKI